jgi:hypothetical protein
MSLLRGRTQSVRGQETSFRRLDRPLLGDTLPRASPTGPLVPQTRSLVTAPPLQARIPGYFNSPTLRSRCESTPGGLDTCISDIPRCSFLQLDQIFDSAHRYPVISWILSTFLHYDGLRE